MKYTHFFPIFKGIISIILSLQNIASVQTDDHQLRVNVTRQSDGDILVFDDKVECASFKANCSRVPNNKRKATKTYTCDSCKCLSGYNAYVLTENQCINTNKMTTVNCDRIFRQKQVTVVTKSTKAINRPIPGYLCKIKEQNPEFYLDNNGTGLGTWIRMMDVNFSLRINRRYRRPRSWFVTFNDNAISKMLSNYAGKIAKLKLSCIMRRWFKRKQINLCVMFKIAGSITGVINSTPVNINGTYTLSSTQTRVDTTISVYHPTNDHSTELPSAIKTSLSSENNHAQDKKSKSVKTTHTIWIIITVLIVIIIVLTGVVVLVCFKKRKTKKSTEEYQSRSIRVHEYDVPMKSQVHRVDPQGADHIYATISDMQNAVPATCSSSEYQELNPRDRDKDASHYQSLVRPSDLQYVDVLPPQAETNT